MQFVFEEWSVTQQGFFAPGFRLSFEFEFPKGSCTEVIKEIIHIQGGSKNTKTLPILSELLTSVPCEFSAFLVLTAW